MSLLLVAPGELPAADVAGERFFAGVRSDVRGEVVGSGEGPHAYPALKRLLTGVDPDVSGELVGPGESPVAVFHRTSVRSLVHRRFARPVRVLPRFDWDEFEWYWGLLVDLREDLVAFAGGWVVFGELDAGVRGRGGGLLLGLWEIGTAGAVRFLFGY